MHLNPQHQSSIESLWCVCVFVCVRVCQCSCLPIGQFISHLYLIIWEQCVAFIITDFPPPPGDGSKAFPHGGSCAAALPFQGIGIERALLYIARPQKQEVRSENIWIWKKKEITLFDRNVSPSLSLSFLIPSPHYSVTSTRLPPIGVCHLLKV